MKIFFIINTGRRERSPADVLIQQFHSLMDEAGVNYRIQKSASLEETEQYLQRAIEEGFDTLWIGGGDGTINNALNQTFGKNVAYGIVPMGTVNALAQALRLPLDPVEAVKYLLKAEPVAMDIGRVADRYFFLYATVGIHAAVFHNIDKRLKKRWGKVAFWESGIRTLWRKSRLPRFLMQMELADAPPGEHIVQDYGYGFTLSNVANYAGFGTFTNEDAASPGYFELHHFRRNRIMPMLVWFTLLRVLGVEKSRPESGSIFHHIRWVKVRSHRRLSVQVDGEPIKPRNNKNLFFECLDDAVKVMLCADEARMVRGTPTADVSEH